MAKHKSSLSEIELPTTVDDQKDLEAKVLLHESKVLSKYMDIPTLLPILRSRQLVTGDEYIHLLSRWEQGFRESTSGLLLELLPRKQPHWAKVFFQVLQEEDEHQGHTHLVELLGKDMEQASQVKLSMLLHLILTPNSV